MDQSELMDLLKQRSQLDAAIKAAFLAWVFMPVLCKIVKHGEIVIKIHDGQVRDVKIPLEISFRTDSTN